MILQKMRNETWKQTSPSMEVIQEMGLLSLMKVSLLLHPDSSARITLFPFYDNLKTRGLFFFWKTSPKKLKRPE